MQGTRRPTQDERIVICAGETWQATLGDGSEVFFEQISHHPPVSAFQLIGPGVLLTSPGCKASFISPHCVVECPCIHLVMTYGSGR